MRRFSKSFTCIATTLAIVILTGSVFAQEKKTQQTSSSSKTKQAAKKSVKKQATSNRKPNRSGKPVRRKPPELSASDEKAAIQFARRHHPELNTLIDSLRSNKKQTQYDRAIRTLANARKRIESHKGTPRYDRELNEWKMSSRINVLLAKLKMASPGDVERLESTLKKIVKQRAAARKKQLLADRARLLDRLGKINESIKKLGDGDAEFERLVGIYHPEKRRRTKDAKTTRSGASAGSGAAAKQ